MRQIKFRAWDEQKKKMIQNPHFEVVQGITDVNGYFAYHGKNTVKFMQFTGLLDKNEKEIYEGDVILESFKIKNKETGAEKLNETRILVQWKHQEEDYEVSHFYGYDIYDGKDISYSNPFWDCLEMKYEVIGNIYENPELLK